MLSDASEIMKCGDAYLFVKYLMHLYVYYIWRKVPHIKSTTGEDVEILILYYIWRKVPDIELAAGVDGEILILYYI